MRKNQLAFVGIVAMGLLFLPLAAEAQDVGKNAVPTASAATVTLDVREARISDVLTKLFRDAKVDFIIDPRISGFVTLHLTDQPFENALRLIMHSSDVPLTYTHENGVYEVTLRPVPQTTVKNIPYAPITEAVAPTKNSRQFATITLNYIDAADLAQLLGIQLLPINVRASAYFPGATGFSNSGIIGSGANSGTVIGNGTTRGGTGSVP